jgi:tripartite-type tricarboxylate transporter receptor subunit TctC
MNSAIRIGGRLCAAVLGFAALVAQPQDFPSKSIRFVVPYPPGGVADTFSRALSQQLSERLGQPLVAENKPGASAIIGAEAVAKAPPDGYTLFLGSVSSLAINVGAFKKLPYDPVKDFAPVSLVFYTPLFLIVNNDLQAKSVQELVAYAKANPGIVNFGSVGFGSSIHLAAELFKTMAGIAMVHVPYKGSSQVLPDLISGRVQMLFDGGTFLPHVRAGKVRLLAVTSSRRLSYLPDVPTMAEAGVPGYELVIWFGVVAPAGTPKPVVDRLSREIADVVKQPAFRQRFLESGTEPLASTPEAFAELITSDTRKWTRLLRDSGVQPE